MCHSATFVLMCEIFTRLISVGIGNSRLTKKSRHHIELFLHLNFFSILFWEKGILTFPLFWKIWYIFIFMHMPGKTTPWPVIKMKRKIGSHFMDSKKCYTTRLSARSFCALFSSVIFFMSFSFLSRIFLSR